MTTSDVPVISILKRHLETSVHYQQVASKVGHPEGYAYVKIPDWEVRQIIEHLERQADPAADSFRLLALSNVSLSVDATQSKQIEQLQAQVKLLREALDPFARVAAIQEGLNIAEDRPMFDWMPRAWPTMRDCQQARQALTSTEPKP